MSVTKEIQFGYYSEKQKNRRCNAMRSQRGRYPKSSIYLNTNGEKVEVTEVSKKSPEEFENIFLKDELGSNKSQIIFAKRGFLKETDDTRKLILFDGKFLNTDEKKTTVFNFSRTEFDLSNYLTKSITHPKVQELNTYFLLKCNYSFYIDKVKERFYKYQTLI